MPDAATPVPRAGGPRVIAVVVAWNRRDLLCRNLDGLAAQRRPVDGVVVIDNASTDDSAAVAREHPVVTEVVTMPENLGGAGGFAAGIARAVVSHDADLVWIMDDDTIPTPDALAALLEARLGYDGEVALLASRADWTDGREHPMNTPRERFGLSDPSRARAAAVDAQEVRSASFVSILLDAAAIRTEGLPVADFFLWNDDFEYTARILRHRVGLYVPASRVVHATKTFGSSDVDPGARFFNETRNKVWTFTRSPALGARDRVLYAGSTVLRWTRMLARSKDRGTLLRYGASGLRAGVHAPRTTADVLAGTPVADDVRQLLSGGSAAVGTSAFPESASFERTPFSVLLPVYAGDRAEFFRRAIASVTVEQELRPDELVVVRDGPVGPELDAVLADLRAGELTGGVPVVLFELERNVGLARALEAGLARCAHEVVARADADDVSLPARFAVQLPVFAGRRLDLMSAAIAEFSEDESRPGIVRTWPTEADEIARTARLQDPFNHPAVVYRRSAVAAAGGYQHLDKMEDYWLFARMIAHGARVGNVAEPLVLYRVGAGAYGRRGGLDMLRSELALQSRLLAEGFTTRGQYVRNVFVRGVWRLIPVAVRRPVYRAASRLRGRLQTA